MKNLILLSILLGSTSAFAQVTTKVGAQYREFTVSVKMTTGTQKGASLQVNTGLKRRCYGNLDIPQQGYCDYVVTGTVVDDSKTCNFEVLRTQTDLKHPANDPALRNRRDRSGTIMLCSGLRMEVSSIDALLSDASTSATVSYADEQVGEATISSTGLKTVK